MAHKFQYLGKAHVAIKLWGYTHPKAIPLTTTQPTHPPWQAEKIDHV